MPHIYNIYRFDDFVLDDENETLFEGENEILLTETEYRILLLLIRNRKRPLNKADILDDVWGLDSEVNDTNVSTQIHNLRNKISGTNREKYIKSEKFRKGYRFVASVSEEIKVEPDTEVPPKNTNQETAVVELSVNILPGKENKEKIEPDTGEKIVEIDQTTAENKEKMNFQKSSFLSFLTSDALIISLSVSISCLMLYFGYYFSNCADDCLVQKIYLFLVSASYGILAGIGVLLECAYEYDKYGWMARRIVPLVSFLNFAAMYAGFNTAGSFLPVRLGYAFTIAVSILILSAVTSCLLASRVLPNAPITAATIQTQPALAAFAKNIFFYFVPLYGFFCLLVFCLGYSLPVISQNLAFPIGFTIIFLIAAGISYRSTNYLSDKLLIERDGRRFTHHSLFFNLLFLRAVFMFGPTAGCIIWYFFRLLN